jgi:hypothetical protein
MWTIKKYVYLIKTKQKNKTNLKNKKSYIYVKLDSLKEFPKRACPTCLTSHFSPLPRPEELGEVEL